MEKMKEIYGDFKGFVKSSSEHRISTSAAEAAFFLILSLIPFLMLCLSIIHFTPVTEADVMREVTMILPDAIDPIALVVIEEIYNKSVTILSISAVVAVWSSARGIMALKNGLNIVYDVKEDRNYFLVRLNAMVYVVLFLAVVIMMLVLLVFGRGIQNLLEQKIATLGDFSFLIMLIRTGVSLFVMMAFFCALYKVLPAHKFKLRQQWPGALFSSMGWFLFSFGFSFYVSNVSRISYTYGSLSTLVILMLWLYFGMYILFLGAEINAHFVIRKAKSAEK